MLNEIRNFFKIHGKALVINHLTRPCTIRRPLSVGPSTYVCDGAAPRLQVSFAPIVPSRVISSQASNPSPRLSVCSFSVLTAPHRWSLQEEVEFREIEQWASTFTKECIPTATIERHFARSSGPGGQNVNKVNSKAEIRFKLDSAHWIHELVRERLKTKHSRYVNSHGEVVIASEVHRNQKQNLEDCFKKLYEAIIDCCKVPAATTKEQQQKVAKLHTAYNERRLEAKQRAKEKKRDRYDD